MGYRTTSHGFLVEAHVTDKTNGNSYDVSKSVERITVKKNFIDNIFSLYSFELRITTDLRDTFRDDEISLHARISYYNIGDANTSEEGDENNIAEVGVLFDDEIRIYSKPFTTTVSKKEDETDEASTQDESAPFCYYSLTGIPEKEISKNESVMNNIYLDCEVADVIVNMLTTIDTTSNIYMQDTTNKNIFKDVIIPPVGIAEAIEFLDEQYFIYKNPANLYIDTDSIYLYDPISLDTPKTNRIEYRIISSEATEEVPQSALPDLDENNNIRFIYRSIPSFDVSKKIAAHKLGSHTIFYYYDDNFQINTRNKDNSESYKKDRYI